VISVTPETLNFGSAVIGETSPTQPVTVTNTGTANLTLGTLTVTGTYPGDYQLASNTCNGNNLSPQATCSFAAAFKPTAVGARTASVSIPNDDSTRPEVFLNLSGVGINQTVNPDDCVSSSGYCATPSLIRVSEKDEPIIAFTVSRRDASEEETVFASTARLDTFNSGDYIGDDGQPVYEIKVHFSKGATVATQQVRIKILDDQQPETDERFLFLVQGLEGQKPDTFLANATFTIEDDDVQTLRELKDEAAARAIELMKLKAPYFGDGTAGYTGKGYDATLNKYVDANTVANGFYDYWLKGVPTAGAKGLDCSGLTMWAINGSYFERPLESVLPAQSASAQWEVTEQYPNSKENNDLIERGDIMYFDAAGGHVALYVGSFNYEGDTYDVIESGWFSGDGVKPRKSVEVFARPGYVGYGRIIRETATKSTVIRTGSPVDLIVVDPDGNVITPDSGGWTGREWTNEVAGALYYSIIETEADGTPITQVMAPRLKKGDYIIRPMKRSDALPDAVYSIYMITEAGGVILADEVPIQDIPERGYGVTVGDTGVTPFVPTNRPPTAIPSVSHATQCSSSNGALVVLDGTASFDPDGDSLSYRWIGPFGTLTGDVVTAMLPLGSHGIELIVDDGKGGVDSETVDTLIEDSVPPTINVSASPSTLWPPNNKMVPIAVTVNSTDACDPAPRVTLQGITANERTKAGDIVVDAEGNISLRATRRWLGRGPGRVYTITYSAEDASGNTAMGSGIVTVPRIRLPWLGLFKPSLGVSSDRP
jgi:cell wall-associated NlpC family hydrolase